LKDQDKGQWVFVVVLFRRHITVRKHFQAVGWKCFFSFFFENYNIGTLWFFYFLSEDAKIKKSICNNCRPKSLLLSFMYNYSVTFWHYIIILIYAALWWLHSSSFAGRVQLLWWQQLLRGKVEKTRPLMYCAFDRILWSQSAQALRDL